MGIIGNFSRLFFGTDEAAQILTKVVTLTNAQIIALPTTPVTLISAPGSGYRIKLIAGSVHLNAVGPYTNIDSVYFVLEIAVEGDTWVTQPAFVNDSTLDIPLTQGTNAFGGTGHYHQDLIVPYFTAKDAGTTSGGGEWVINELHFNVTDLDNKAIVASIDNNGSGVLTAGNASNTLKITLSYIIEAL